MRVQVSLVQKEQAMGNLPEKSLDLLKSLAGSGYCQTCHLGTGGWSMRNALTSKCYATERIAVFSAEGVLLPPDTVQGKGMTTRQIIEITEAGRVRASQP